MEISIVNFIAASVCAYEHNDHQVKGYGQGEVNSEKVFSNTMLLLAALEIKENHGLYKVTKLTITQEHLDKANLYKEVLQNDHMLKILSSKNISNWEKGVYDLLSIEVFDQRTIQTKSNMMAFLPQMAQTILDKQAKMDKINQLPSKHQGQVGAKLELDVTIMQHFYMNKYNTNLTKAVDQSGNLYIWWGQLAFKENQKLKITGKVKKHGIEHETGTKSTNLNYVKVKEYAE